jgi:hypothetical protein
MEESSGPSKKAIIGLIVIVLLVIAATGAVIVMSNNGSKADGDAVASNSPSTSPTTSTSTSPSSSPVSSASTFKDGSYSATGNYVSPGGDESIDVNVTLSDGNGTITAVSVSPHANVQEASDYQGQFVSGYKSMVIGKKITDVNLSRVSGSSLTSIGFNSAVDQIKSKAEA